MQPFLLSSILLSMFGQMGVFLGALQRGRRLGSVR
jgi:hypothetical protein